MPCIEHIFLEHHDHGFDAGREGGGGEDEVLRLQASSRGQGIRGDDGYDDDDHDLDDDDYDLDEDVHDLDGDDAVS